MLKTLFMALKLELLFGLLTGIVEKANTFEMSGELSISVLKLDILSGVQYKLDPRPLSPS